MPSNKSIYRIRFMSEGRVIEVYARSVAHGELFGFVQVEDLVWGKRSEVIVDPGEDQLKSEFTGVKRTYIPLHAVVRIDEVDKTGPAKIFPLAGGAEAAKQATIPVYAPGGRPGKGD